MTWTWRRLNPTELDHELLWGCLVLLGLVGVVVLDRMAIVPVVLCPFKWMTGLPCLTCGGTRAVLALVDGRLLESLSFNPVVAAGTLVAAPYSVYALSVSALRLPRLRILLTDRARACGGSLLLGVAALWWIALMALGR